MISAVVLTRNEEKSIEKCLKSVLWCDEIVVIDDYSTDNTIKIAKKWRAKVYKRSLNSDFSAQRNYGLTKAKGNWILFIDADEVVTSKLQDEIIKKTRDLGVNGYLVRREYFFLGRKMTHGEIGQTFILRLGRKGKGKWKREVHEEWGIKGKVDKLDSPLLHFPSKGISEFVSDVNKYSRLHAYENKKEGKRPNFLYVIFYPVGKFLMFYILKLGFLDGVAGFILAVIMSFHSFLAWSRLWLITNRQEKHI
ncbi:MAG TPA: glycosyltransferase family 2 protein [Patescibacteria group bacterium]